MGYFFAAPGKNARIPADKSWISLKSEGNLKSPKVEATYKPNSMNEGKVLICHGLIGWGLLLHISDLSLLFRES